MPEKVHSIKAVARQTGLSVHVIRAWEKRYQAVTPMRTETKRRRYSGAEVRRLQLLRAATLAGHSICCVAQLPDEKLESLTAGRAFTAAAAPAVQGWNQSAEEILSEAMEAVKNLDGPRLENLLSNGVISLGHQGLLRRVVVPLTEQIGSLWREGALRICHEHLASSVLRTVLGNTAKQFVPHASAPVLVIATPAGQNHELGAAIAAATASQHGWKVTYLGTSLPAHEIASAAFQSGARAIGLSIVYPMNDPQVDAELAELRRLVGRDIDIIVGGRAAPSHLETLKRIDALVVQCLMDFTDQLDRLHATRVKSSETKVKPPAALDAAKPPVPLTGTP